MSAYFPETVFQMGNPHLNPARTFLSAVVLAAGLFLIPLRAQEAPNTGTEPAPPAGSDAELIANLTEACSHASDSFSAELAVQSVDNLKAHARMETKNLLYLLNRSLEKEKAAGWIEFLRLEHLRKTLSEQETDMSVVTSSLEKFGQNEEGLELPEFSRLRNILADYVEAVGRAEDDTVHDDFRYVCENLPADVQEYLDDPASVEAPGRIAASLDFMDECQQNSNSVRDITNLLRARFAQPNIQASLGQRVLFPEQALTVTEPTIVQETVRGTPTYGSGTMEGTLKPAFVANDDVAEIRLVFKADIRTNTTAVSSMGVSVQTNSYGKVTIYKPVYFDGKEISLGVSSSASNLNAAITGINTGRGPIGSKVVYDRVGQEYPYSKAESQRLMENKVVRRFDERVQVITRANERLAKAWNLLKKYNYMPEVKTRTTANMLELNARVGSSRQITAAKLPAIQPGPHDLVVRVHQSAINNPLHELFSGRSLSEKEVQAWIRENIPEADIDRLAEEASEKLQEETEESDPAGDNFCISFCEELPACVTFNNDVLGIHVRVDAFAQKEKEFPGLDIDVEYALEKKDGEWVLALKDYEAWPPEIDRGAVVPARYQVIRRQVKNRLQAALPESIPLKAIPLFELPTGEPQTEESGAAASDAEKAGPQSDEPQSAADGGNSAAADETDETDAGKPRIRGYLNAGELTFTEGWLVLGADYKPIQ